MRLVYAQRTKWLKNNAMHQADEIKMTSALPAAPERLHQA
jgi:hypothetical protein